LLLLTACSGSLQKTSNVTARATPNAAANAIANGRAIFQTGRDADGARIIARSKPLFQNCSACHKPDGSGGRRFPDGAVSADLRRRTMIHDRPPWTLALLERAITTGIDNEGKPLDPVMPRWKLSQRDRHDVAQYLITQLK